jgi:BirA family biotin operon repressor/biotin-[acetyl-CoA-carboxylase] ligase
MTMMLHAVHHQRAVQALQRLDPEAVVECVATIDSTNAELMRRSRLASPGVVCLVADSQTAGRGRLGRVWTSAQASPVAPSQAQAPGALLMSLGLPYAPQDWSGLSLAVGLAVARALDADGALDVQLKWPNDVWVVDRKLAGILLETAVCGGTRYLVVGIGINLRAPMGEALRTPAVGLHEWQPARTRDSVAADVMEALVPVLQQFSARGLAPLMDEYAGRDALRGRSVHVVSPVGQPLVGRADGVAADGSLRVVGADGVCVLVNSSDVSVRPSALVADIAGAAS